MSFGQAELESKEEALETEIADLKVQEQKQPLAIEEVNHMKD